MKKKILSIFAIASLAFGLASCTVSQMEWGNYDTYGYDQAYLRQLQQEALFLSDKMAYELGLNSAQYEAVYEINLDYLIRCRNSSDITGSYWARRNTDLSYVLSAWQYNRYLGANYFYRPVYYSNNRLSYTIYTRYTNRSYYYYSKPKSWNTYRGGRNMQQNSYYANRNYGQPVNNRPMNTWSKERGPRTNNNVHGNPGLNNSRNEQSRTFGNGSIAPSSQQRTTRNGSFGGSRSTPNTTVNTRPVAGTQQRTSIGNQNSRSNVQNSRSASNNTVNKSSGNTKQNNSSNNQNSGSRFGGHR